MKFLALSAGHNPDEPGFRFGDLSEWRLASGVADLVQEILAPSRLPILRVPEFPGPQTESLRRVIRFVNAYDPEVALAVELHYNAFDGEASGTEIIVAEGAASDTRALAEILLHEVLAACGTRNRGIRNDTQSARGRSGFCRHINAHSMLLEIGFLSDIGDREKTCSPEGRKRAAQGIARALAQIHGRG